MKLSSEVVGHVGLVVHGSLWCVSAWRLLHHFRGIGSLCFTPQQQEPHPSIVWTSRRIFHTLLGFAMTVDCIAYADLAQIIIISEDYERAKQIAYVLLEVLGRSSFEFLAYAIVTALWFRIAVGSSWENPTWLKVLPKALAGWAFLLITVSLIQAADILMLSASSAWSGSSWAYRLHLFVEGLSWAFQATMSSVCLWLTWDRIIQLATWPQSTTMTKVRVICKALLPMMFCVICYTTRAVWLLLRLRQMPLSPFPPEGWQGNPAWWIGFAWVPTIIPSLVLLYSARKRDREAPSVLLSQSSRGDPRGEPLLSTPVPPAEAFVSFRRFAEDGDIVSPFITFTRIQDNPDDDDGGEASWGHDEEEGRVEQEGAPPQSLVQMDEGGEMQSRVESKDATTPGERHENTGQ